MFEVAWMMMHWKLPSFFEKKNLKDLFIFIVKSFFYLKILKYVYSNSQQVRI